MNWKHIIERLEFWKKQDDKWQEAMNAFCETVAPQEYAPILNPKYAESYIEGVSQKNKDLKDWMSYYMYEVMWMKSAKVKDEKGRKYDFCKKKDVIKFFEDNYGDI